MALWTLDDIPAEVRAGGFLYEPVNSIVGANNQITSVPDTWGGTSLTQPTSANQIFRGDRLGYPSFVWPDTTSSRLMTAAVGPLAWIMFVAQWKSGTEEIFSNNSGLVVGSSNNASRVFGQSGTSNLWQNAGSSWAQQARKNAGDYSPDILPLPISLVEIRNTTTPFPSPMRLGYANTAGTSWNGAMWLVIGLTVEPTGDLLARIQGYTAWRFGIQSKLPSGHPYRNAPPETVATVDGVGSGSLRAISGSGLGESVSSGVGFGSFGAVSGAASGSVVSSGTVSGLLSSLTGLGYGSVVSVGSGSGLLPVLLGSGLGGIAIDGTAVGNLPVLIGSGEGDTPAPPKPSGRIATVLESANLSIGTNAINYTLGYNGQTFTEAA